MIGRLLLGWLVGSIVGCSSAGTAKPSGAGSTDGGATADGAAAVADAGSSSDAGTSTDADAATSTGDAATATDAGSAGGCTMTLSGGVTQSGPCNLSLGYVASKGRVVFGATLVAQPSDAFGSDLSTSTTPTTGTYGAGDVLMYASTVLVSSKVWLINNGSPGVFTLTIASLGTPAPSGGDTFYPQAHGTVDATLAPVAPTGATGNVLLHVDF